MTIDNEWSALQDEVRQKFGNLLTNRRAYAFVNRCIYCYKAYLERVEQDEHNWYLTVMKAIEMRFKW